MEVPNENGAQLSAETAAPKKPRGKKKHKKLIIAVIAVAVAAAVAAAVFGAAARKNKTADTYTYAAAEKRDIVQTLTASAALQPADSYTVATLVSGDILTANFEEGDVVKKDDVLYTIDSSDAATSIEQAELQLQQSQRAYDDKVASQADLTVTAPISGVVSGITAKAGDSVGAQMAVATIENTATLTLTEYYSQEYSGKIYKGMTAAVSVPDQMLNLTGRVSEVSGLTRTSSTGVKCFAVTVSVSNPGSLAAGAAATCCLDGNIYPAISDDDGLDASQRQVVYAGVSGQAAQICVRNGDTVAAGTVLMKLSSDTLSDEILNAADSVQSAKLSLQNQKNSLDNYTVTAPIDGTIVQKYYKQGEKSESGKTLCTIYDLSYLTLTLSIDELDISKVAVGQTASITADAVSGKTYTGTVTRVGINGTTSGGVTTYPVDVRIDETDGLFPGMNADAVITVSENKGVVAVPAGAVERSNRVLVKSADGTTDDGAPTGYVYRTVTTGATDGTYVQIVSGLSEGDTVAYVPETAPEKNDEMQMMMGGGEQQEPPAGGNAPGAAGGNAASGSSAGGDSAAGGNG